MFWPSRTVPSEVNEAYLSCCQVASIALASRYINPEWEDVRRPAVQAEVLVDYVFNRLHPPHRKRTVWLVNVSDIMKREWIKSVLSPYWEFSRSDKRKQCMMWLPMDSVFFLHVWPSKEDMALPVPGSMIMTIFLTLNHKHINTHSLSLLNKGF